MLFKIALLIHIAGAIIGLGPTMAFGVMGALSGKLGGQQALGIVEAMIQVERKLVTPVATVTQPVTGVLMIFLTGRDENFFSHEWLWVSILAFSIILIIAYGIDNPMIARMVTAMKEGRTETPEFAVMNKKASRNGAIMGTLFILIIVLMVLKPGG